VRPLNSPALNKILLQSTQGFPVREIPLHKCFYSSGMWKNGIHFLYKFTKEKYVYDSNSAVAHDAVT